MKSRMPSPDAPPLRDAGFFFLRMAAASVVRLSLMLPAVVSARDWDKGGSTTDWFTAANWAPDGVPVVADTVYVNTSAPLESPVVVSGQWAPFNRLVVGDQAANSGHVWLQSGALTNNSTQTHVIGNAGYGWLRVSGGFFKTQRDVQLGGVAGGAGVLLVDGGLMNPGWSLMIGKGGAGDARVTGGAVVTGYDVQLGVDAGSTGNLVVSNASVTAGGTRATWIGVAGTGTVTVANGALTTGRDLTIGKSAGSFGQLDLLSGGVTSVWSVTVGDAGSGRFIQRGNVKASKQIIVGKSAGGVGYYELIGANLIGGTDGPQVIVGQGGSGTFVCEGGILQIGGVAGDLVVRSTQTGFGVFRGWGTVNFNDQLINNGLVIADGSGTQHDLNLTMLDGGYDGPTWMNAVENTATNGWYAVNKGRLMLANSAVVVSGQPSSYNWGEDGTDSEIDLVNSARLTLASIAGVNSYFRFYLLAPDRDDVPAAPPVRQFIGVWDGLFAGTPGAIDVEFRYDHVAAGNKILELYRYDEAQAKWVLLESTELSGHRISATGLAAQGTAKLGLFAVAVSTAPASTLISIQ